MVNLDTRIQVCTDFKLQNKLRKESMINKKELGTFCHQYGMEPIRAPSAKKKKIIKKQNKTENRIYRKPYTKKHNRAPQESKPHRKPKYKKLKKKDNVCWKCGRPSHYANSCKIAKKINQIEDKELKKFFLNILINSESDEEESEIEVEQIESANSTEYSKESEEDYCLGLGLCSCENCISDKNINMLNKDQTNTLISIIDKLEDSPLKDEFLSQLNHLIIKSE